MDYQDKSKKWYDDFEQKAFSMVGVLYAQKEKRKIIAIAKTVLKVRKEKIKLYGKDGANKTKIVQLKLLVKTAGAFVKPHPVKDILGYEGVLIK